MLLTLIFATLFLILLVLVLGRKTFAWVVVIAVIAGSLIYQPENKSAIITLAVLAAVVMTLRKLHQWRRARRSYDLQ